MRRREAQEKRRREKAKWGKKKKRMSGEQAKSTHDKKRVEMAFKQKAR